MTFYYKCTGSVRTHGHLRDNNSWMHNSRRLIKGPVRCTLLMHPEDGAERGIEAGDEVIVVSAAGRVRCPVEISESMMPGVVSLPHGYGHDRPGTRLSIAEERPGVSANELTDARQVEPITGVAVLNGVPVQVQPAPTESETTRTTDTAACHVR